MILNVWHISYITNRYSEVSQASVHNCRFVTGDVLLFQHKKYKFGFFGLDGIMSHMGAILNDRIHGSLVIDFNPTSEGAFGSQVIPVVRVGKLQLLRVEDVIKHYPGVVLVRPLLKPLNKEMELKFKQTILTEVCDLEYCEEISSKHPYTYFSLVFSSLIPEISSMLALYLSSLSSSRTSTFCTEAIAYALQKAGLIKNDRYINIRGPISWMHGMVPEYTLIWGKEIHLVFDTYSVL